MKSKNILAAMLLCMISVVASAEEQVGNQATADKSLQEGLVAQEGYQFQVGDTVIISKGSRYLTGERPSRWVHYVRHTIGQIGSRRFPTGVLIRGINSWIDPQYLFLSGAVEQSEAAMRKQAADAAKVETVKEEVREMSTEERIIVEAAAEQHAEQSVIADGVSVEGDSQQKEEDHVVRYPEMNRFTIGLRGGTASLMHDAPAMGNWKAGFDALLDVQYAHYWFSKNDNAYGLLTGLAVGYARSGVANGIDSTYSVITDEGQIDYSISAEDVNEKDGQLQLEVPLMFSMVMNNGMFLNVGPKLILPVYNHYNQTLSNPHINAYFPEEGVTVTDELITGIVSDDQLKSKGKWQSSRLNVMLTAEIGYEWHLPKNRSLALGAYANYSVFDLYEHNPNNKSLIDVTAPSSTSTAVVDVFSATDTYAKGMGYFDCGIKLAYHFDFFKRFDVEK